VIDPHKVSCTQRLLGKLVEWKHIRI